MVRGSIGVVFGTQQNPAVAHVYGVKSGVTVADVKAGGPAEEAGLKAGDTITSVNDHAIKTGDDLVGFVTQQKPGSKLKIDFIRNGQQQSATVAVVDRDKLYGQRAESAEAGPESTPAESKLGITVRPLSPELAERLDVPQKGVVVSAV